MHSAPTDIVLVTIVDELKSVINRASEKFTQTINRIQLYARFIMTTHQSSPLAGQLLTVEEAMDVLLCGRTRFYQRVAAGKVDVIHLGKRSTRVKTSSIEKLIALGVE